MREFQWIDPQEIRFYRDSGGWLAGDWGRRQGPVTAKRLFPLSHAEAAIRVRDLQGAEWGLLRTLMGLEPESRLALESELGISTIMPGIRSIRSIRRRFGRFEWHAATDWGETRFQTEPLYESVAELQDGRRTVTDINGQLYLLPVESDFDPRSRKRLAKWL